jgi:aquaporin Z
MNSSLFKKGIAECIGTFVLVFAACGVAAITNGNLVATAMAFGLVIVAMAYSIGRISGCHINPAVSIAMLIAKKMTFVEFLVYVCAQIIGGLLGALLIFGIAKMADQTLLGNACNYFVNSVQGTKYVIDAGKIIASILVEVVLTFIFVLVILNVTDKKAEESGVAKFAGIIIGLTLTLVHLIGILLTGTSVNPARSIGTAVANLVYGSGEAKALAHVWMFIVGPLAGGALAAVCYNVLFAKDGSDESSKLEA